MTGAQIPRYRIEPERVTTDGADAAALMAAYGNALDEWQQLADRLTGAGIQFIIQPHIRFKGQVGEQATMFLLDPSGNALEFKAFKDIGQLFAS